MCIIPSEINYKSPFLLKDFYKTEHPKHYNENLVKLVSYYTPRMSRIKGDDYVIMFGLQSFIKEYLIDEFNNNFFNKPLADVLAIYEYVIIETMGKEFLDSSYITDLHNLGYLPIQINAIKEGSKVGIKVPMIEITNTHPKFAWVVNSIESLMSAQLWYPMQIANVGVKYRNIVNEWFNKTVDDNVPRASAISEFGMRGGESLESAIHASSAMLLSFNKTATIPAILYMFKYYNNKEGSISMNEIATGGASTEHSVMCSNKSIDGDEETFLNKLIDSIYKKGNFSVVCDSYDYWRILNEVIPNLKNKIINREGVMFVRGDSGDPVQIVIETVNSLWKTFGGSINSKGYKVLKPCVRAIYGDSITPWRAEKIYKILEEQGFASNNVSLGAGSFSLQCVEFLDEYGNLKMSPFTRDTYGVAIKTTYGEYQDPVTKEIIPIDIFKDPITDSGNFKKSQKGCCVVYPKDKNGIYSKYEDGFNYDNSRIKNKLISVFINGKMVNEYSISEIRNRLLL